MASKRYKRRRILIARLQWQLLGITLVYLAATAVMFAAAMFGPLVWQLQGNEPPGFAQTAAATEFLALHRRFWPALIVTFAALSVHSVFTSHRIVGPLYRFRVVFGEVAAGNLVPWTSLRRRDFLVPEAKALNDMVVSLRDRILRIATYQGEAKRCLAGVDRALKTNSVREARTHLAELERTLGELEEQVDHFRLQKESGS